ncbi:MAG: glycosyltransferase family 92 protein [Paracoccaceae bacterium]
MIVKDEAAYLHDWLTFHTLAGARAIILYDNCSTDGTVKIAKAFTGLTVTVIPWQLHASTTKYAMILPRQILAYCHAICTFGGAFRWMAFIDIDEFIVPKDHATITAALETQARFTNISLPWTMFGHSGHDTFPEASVPFAYDQRARRAEGVLLNFKCIVDPCSVTQVSVHKFLTEQMGRNTANMHGQTVPIKQRGASDFITTDILQLNHYYLKSKAETEEKIASTAVSGVAFAKREAAIRSKARMLEADTVKDTAAILFLLRHGIGSDNEIRHKFG